MLSIVDKSVTIKNIENSIIERAFASGWVKPYPVLKTNFKVFFFFSFSFFSLFLLFSSSPPFPPPPLPSPFLYFSFFFFQKKVAIIGSGPAGLAVADGLSKLGHSVFVFERFDFFCFVFF